MKLDKSTSTLQFGLFGGIGGGLIALFGFFVLSPEIDSLLTFLAIRMGIGALVAMMVGPLIFALKK
jgi:hypothetical protein